jgi:hypothetical protein
MQSQGPVGSEGWTSQWSHAELGLVGPQGRVAWQSRAVTPWAYGLGSWQAVAGCSFSRSWCREAFHDLGAQSAEVSVPPCGLHQQSVSPVSQ